jgi:hypothetical protein
VLDNVEQGFVVGDPAGHGIPAQPAIVKHALKIEAECKKLTVPGRVLVSLVPKLL